MTLIDPASVKGIAPPAVAASKPWDRCERGGGKLLSWELGLGRVTMDLPCKNLPGGECRRLVVDKLLYVQRREFFGPDGASSGPPGRVHVEEAPRRWSKHVSCWYEDAETGMAGDNGWGGDY
jgi:hypothetical protein